MRYMLLLHATEAEVHGRTPEWREEAAAFLARFEDELAMSSELEWSEVLDSEEHALVVAPGEEAQPGWFNLSRQGAPLARLWVVRLQDEARLRELTGELAGELDAWIEVRECLAGAQRP